MDAMESSRRSVFPGFDRLGEQRRDLVAELVAVRRGLGLSQTELAALMGTSQSTVARLESGKDDVLLSSLQRYAGAVGRELRWSLRQGGKP
jgi:transcriptional regulator with XRE-family HTH domain